MELSNSTGRSTGYRVTFSGSGSIPRAGSREAELSEARAEADIREGRYETFQSAEHLVRTLRERISESPKLQIVSAGKLGPHSSWRLTRSWAQVRTKVDFFIGGKLVASQTFPQEPARVTLREEEGRFRIDAGAGAPADLKVQQAR